MNFSSGPSTSPSNSIKQKWEEMTYDKRIDRLLQALRDISLQVDRLMHNREDLGRHRHSKDGRPVIVNPINSDSLSTEAQGSQNTSPNPFWNIDFNDEDKTESY